MKERNRAIVKQRVLVSAGKSSRLAELSNKAGSQKNLIFLGNNRQRQFKDCLKPESEIALQQAIKLIEERIAFILESYPIGKKNSLFELRYGVKLDKIELMAVKTVFSLLNLEKTNVRQFALIGNFNSNGNHLVD